MVKRKHPPGTAGIKASARGIGCGSYLPQHFLNLFPEPQGQGSFRPGFLMD